MAFDAGAVKGSLIFDTTQWDAGEDKVNQSLGQMEKKGLDVGKVLKAGFDLAVQGLTASVAASEEFNKAFANVSTLVDTSTVDIGKMQTELLNLDNRLGSATELTDGLYQAISASVDPAKAVAFVGEAAKFAKAGLTSTNKAVDVITTSLNAYGFEADQAGRISDVLFQTIKKGKTTGDQLARAIGKTIPLAATAGVKFEELGASVAVLTRQGNSTSESTTQLNAVISSLVKPSKAAGMAMDKLGWESSKAAIEQYGLVGAAKELIKSTDGSNESVAQLFPNIRALRGVLALTGDGAKDFDDVLNEMSNSAGATQDAFDKQELTMETFDNTVNKLAITLGNELLPFVHAVVAQFTGMIDGFTRSGELAEFLGKAVSYASGAFALLTSALEPVFNGILKAGQEQLTEITTAISGTSDETANALVPFQVFATALGVLSDVANVLIKGFGLLAISIINTIDLASKAGGVLNEIGKFLTFQESDIGGAFDALGDSFGKTVDDFGTNAAELGTAAADTIGNLFSDTTDKALEFQKTFNDAFNDSKNTIELASEAANKNTDATKENTDAVEDSTEAIVVNNEMEWAAMLASIDNAVTLAAETKAIDEKVRALAGLNNTYVRNLELMSDEEAANIRAKEQAEALKETYEQVIQSVEDLAKSLGQDLSVSLFEVGVALGSGADAGKAFEVAIQNIGMAILEAIPSMLLQAGITLLTSGNIPLGLALIGAAGLAALGAGAIAGALGIDEGSREKKAEAEAEAAKVAAAEAKAAEAKAAEAAALKNLSDLGLSIDEEDSEKLALAEAKAAISAAESAQKALDDLLSGGKAAGGLAQGMTLVGEEGPEVVNFGSPAQVYSNEDSQKMMGGFVINFNGPINSEIDLDRAAIAFGRRLQRERNRI